MDLSLQEANQIQCVDVRLILALLGVGEFPRLALGGEFVEACLRGRMRSEFSNLLGHGRRPTAGHWLSPLFQDSMFYEVLHAAIILNMRQL